MLLSFKYPKRNVKIATFGLYLCSLKRSSTLITYIRSGVLDFLSAESVERKEVYLTVHLVLVHDAKDLRGCLVCVHNDVEQPG